MPVTPTKSDDRPADETIKETFESILIAFILAFVFRAYVVEAFVIPTGSMAPTLLGQHVAIRCNECGYDFTVDPDANRIGSRIAQTANVVCPMCHAINVLGPRETPIRSGDRILVHKFIYSFSEPRRWDVVVFKAPHDPDTNFIKRLVGLPNEEVYIHEGNIYTRATSGDASPADAPLRIARKTGREDVQRAVWQPIYHSNFVPLDGGQRVDARRPDWAVPWVVEAGDWEPLGNRRAYTFRGPGAQGASAEAAGRLRFDFQTSRFDEPQWYYPYDQARHVDAEPIEDVRIALVIRPQGTGTRLSLSTTARLAGPQRERLTATINRDGAVVLESVDLQSGARMELAREQADPLPAEENTSVELWFADAEASVWIDGDCVLRKAFEVEGVEALQRRQPPAMTPTVNLEISGGPATLYNVELDRDLYYSNSIGAEPLRGALFTSDTQRTRRTPVQLDADEFWCLGDNGPRSSDGRYWEGANVNPWVQTRLLPGKADPGGIVPRELLMGRAFFVYFPAPYTTFGIPLPNFGDMRFIH